MPSYGKWIAVIVFRLFAFGKYVLFSLWSRQRMEASSCDLPLHAFEFRPAFEESELKCFRALQREHGIEPSNRPWGTRSFRVWPWIKAAKASTPAMQGALLSWLANCLDIHTVLELGTHRGVGTSYLARATSVKSVWTIDADGQALLHARKLWNCLGVHHKVYAIHGRFEEVLEGTLRRMPSPQLVYMDGHHEGGATRRYFEIIVQHMPSGGWIIVDDIRWSGDMYRCWKDLCAHPRTKMAIDVGYMGIISLHNAETPHHSCRDRIFWLPRPGWRWLWR